MASASIDPRPASEMTASRLGPRHDSHPDISPLTKIDTLEL